MDMRHFWEFTLGNLITIVIGIISLVVAWQKVRDKVEELAGRVQKQEAEVEQYSKLGVITIVNQHERRLSQIEVLVAEIGAIKTDLVWIKNKLEKKT